MCALRVRLPACRYMGPFLLFSFIVLVIMVVLSMFFAIVGEAYGECMEKAKTGETFWDSPIAKVRQAGRPAARARACGGGGGNDARTTRPQ